MNELLVKGGFLVESGGFLVTAPPPLENCPCCPNCKCYKWTSNNDAPNENWGLPETETESYFRKEVDSAQVTITSITQTARPNFGGCAFDPGGEPGTVLTGHRYSANFSIDAPMIFQFGGLNFKFGEDGAINGLPYTFHLNTPYPITVVIPDNGPAKGTAKVYIRFTLLGVFPLVNIETQPYITHQDPDDDCGSLGTMKIYSYDESVQPTHENDFCFNIQECSWFKFDDPANYPDHIFWTIALPPGTTDPNNFNGRFRLDFSCYKPISDPDGPPATGPDCGTVGGCVYTKCNFPVAVTLDQWGPYTLFHLDLVIVLIGGTIRGYVSACKRYIDDVLVEEHPSCGDGDPDTIFPDSGFGFLLYNYTPKIINTICGITTETEVVTGSTRVYTRGLVPPSDVDLMDTGYWEYE